MLCFMTIAHSNEQETFISRVMVSRFISFFCVGVNHWLLSDKTTLKIKDMFINVNCYPATGGKYYFQLILIKLLSLYIQQQPYLRQPILV